MRLVRCCIVLCMLLAAVSACAEVMVVSTYPADGDTKVDPKLAAIRVRFSEAVNPTSYSFVNTDDGAPVPFAGKPVFSRGQQALHDRGQAGAWDGLCGQHQPRAVPAAS